MTWYDIITGTEKERNVSENLRNPPPFITQEAPKQQFNYRSHLHQHMMGHIPSFWLVVLSFCTPDSTRAVRSGADSERCHTVLIKDLVEPNWYINMLTLSANIISQNLACMCLQINKTTFLVLTSLNSSLMFVRKMWFYASLLNFPTFSECRSVFFTVKYPACQK